MLWADNTNDNNDDEDDDERIELQGLCHHNPTVSISTQGTMMLLAASSCIVLLLLVFLVQDSRSLYSKKMLPLQFDNEFLIGSLLISKDIRYIKLIEKFMLNLIIAHSASSSYNVKVSLNDNTDCRSSISHPLWGESKRKSNIISVLIVVVIV